ncbi:MAG: efflux RND transporter periplasmic adaptor subunit [Gammaproteobacteria bacterium]|nr:efflux RND transporter periplasmic adaptor subunit [Gammaproteobacteria bacterium]
MNNENTVAGILAAATVRRSRWRWPVVGVMVLAVAALTWWWLAGDAAAPSYRTAEVTRGELVVSVSATGTLQPLNSVDVGSELSGTIAKVEVDFNDRVEAGQVLARLDRELLDARLVEARATLRAAEAKVREAAATVTETRLALKRCEDLVVRQMCAQSDLDKARAAFERARAGEAMAKAQAAQARAAVDAQETNLRKSVIRAPMGGIVLNRQVEAGQTVAASFQTPVLFTLADDLARMELVVAVDEADIGQVRTGQSATFTVDAHPGRSFKAEVKQIRQAPKTVEGVVTYETVLSVSNDDLALMPGMTATADIVSTRLEDVLLVPNTALRFTPPVEVQTSRPMFMGAQRRAKIPPKAREPDGRQTIYILQDGAPVPVNIRPGASDGRNTQVLAGDLSPGAALVIDVLSKPK